MTGREPSCEPSMDQTAESGRRHRWHYLDRGTKTRQLICLAVSTLASRWLAGETGLWGRARPEKESRGPIPPPRERTGNQ
jgi:hypothetical protein